MPLSVRRHHGMLLMLVILAGCGTEPLSFGTLTLRLDVQPALVSAADSFTVRLVVRNVGGHDTTLTSGCSVPTFFALDGPGGVVYPVPGYGCLAVITQYRIAAGDSLTFMRRFAAQYASQTGYPPLPPGEHAVFTDWQIGGLPVLRQGLTVIATPSR